MRTWQMTLGVVLALLAAEPLCAQEGSGASDQLTIGPAALLSTTNTGAITAYYARTDAYKIMAADVPGLYLGYTHRFEGPLALDVSLTGASLDLHSKLDERYGQTAYQWEYKGNVPAYSLSAGVQYHFRRNAALDPYLGIGANVMWTQRGSDEEAWYENANSQWYALRPMRRGHAGWFAQAGINWRLSPHVLLKLEEQYVRNGLVMQRVAQAGWYNSEALWGPAGNRLVDMNPLMTVFALGFRWGGEGGSGARPSPPAKSREVGPSDQITVGVAAFVPGLNQEYVTRYPEGVWTNKITASDVAAPYVGYTHRFRGHWALDASLMGASTALHSQEERIFTWYRDQWGWDGRMPVWIFTVGPQYHFCEGGALDPYVGAGVNVMWTRSRSDEEAWFFYNDYFYGLRPIRRGSVGWAVQAGLNWNIGKHVVLKLEEQYVRNGVFMEQVVRHGWMRFSWWDLSGNMRMSMNPWVTVFAAGMRW